MPRLEWWSDQLFEYNRQVIMGIETSFLYQLVEGFSVGDVRNFKEYLRSPYFNRNEDLLRLFELIRNPKRTEKEHIWKKLKGKEPFDDDQFRQLMMQLYRLAKAFIAQRAYEQSDMLKDQFLLKGLSERNLDKNFQKELKALEKSLEVQPLRDASYFRARIQIDDIYESWIAKTTSRSEYSSRLDSLLANVRHYYDYRQYHLDVSLRAQRFARPPVDEEVPPASRPITVEMMRQLHDLVLRFNVVKWHALYENLKKHKAKFSYNDSYDIFTGLQNLIVINLDNQNAETFYGLLFDLFDFGINNDILFVEDSLPPYYYRNIAEVALFLDKNEYSLDFTERYKDKIGDRFRDNAYAINLATYSFNIGAYRECLRLLHPVKEKDIFLRLAVRMLRIKCYFELEETELLDAETAAIKNFLINNSSIPDHKRKAFEGRIRYITKLYHLRDPQKLEKLKAEIRETALPADLKWLRRHI